MIDRNSDFFRMSKEIAADFLQSTVIIDDFSRPEISFFGRSIFGCCLHQVAGHQYGDKTPLAQAEHSLPQQAAEESSLRSITAAIPTSMTKWWSGHLPRRESFAQ